MRGLYEPAVAAMTAIGVLNARTLHLQCPPLVVQARTALAQTPLASLIRQQVLPSKLLAVGAIALVSNIPFGMVREHTGRRSSGFPRTPSPCPNPRFSSDPLVSAEKFSWQWFVAVHASIPFVALWRKATVLPKYSIAMTIASAIVGQAIGAAFERARLAEEAEARKAAQAPAGPQLPGKPERRAARGQEEQGGGSIGPHAVPALFGSIFGGHSRGVTVA